MKKILILLSCVLILSCTQGTSPTETINIENGIDKTKIVSLLPAKMIIKDFS